MSDSAKEKLVTAFKSSAEIKKQSQSHPGLDADMQPTAEHVKQELWDENGKPFLRDYKGTDKLLDKKALITGGDSGIGRAVAIFFALEGADVSIVYLPVEQKDAEWVRTHIESNTKRKVNLIPLDLTHPDSPTKVVKSHLDTFGRIDILVNNASTQIMSEGVETTDRDNVEHTFKSNILQMIHLTREVIPHLRRGSAIINTTSVTAYKGSPSLPDYSATKGAIVSFTRSLAGQLAPKGIRVNGVAPGPFFTPLQPASRPAENMEDWEVGSIPLHGRAGQPSEIAEVYVLLAGPGGNYITGSVIHVNGGQHIGGS